MENQRIVHLYELAISQSDLKKIDENELAFISTLAFAIDEISIFQKLTVQSFTMKPNSDELKYLHQIQENVITRVLCSKVFEGIKVFEHYVKLVERSGDAAKREKLGEYEKELHELKEVRSYDLAKVIRDHSTNHYITSETKENIRFVPDKVRLLSYLHKNRGNSFYPFGEEYVFLARIGRHYSKRHEREFSLDDIREWVDWNVAASDWLSKMFADYLIWMHRERFPEWVLRPRKPYLEMELFAELDEHPLPLIFSAENYLARKEGAEKEKSEG